MSNPFHEDDGPLPPKLLRTPLEIASNLKQLQQGRTPLMIRFPERSQRFQSFLVAVDRDRNLIALDELVPNDGERLLLSGEGFSVEAYHEGVRIAWECSHPVTPSELDGTPCYWCWMPDEVTYHQRRNAFRVTPSPGEPIRVTLGGGQLGEPVSGLLLDVSATGCKARFSGNLSERLQSGEVYEAFRLDLPFGALTTAVEMRHVHYEEKVDMTFIGLRFYNLSGLDQRQIERFVYQLQREARRAD